jgi:hypothetical protein
MVVAKLISGYVGKHGTLTATREVILPCRPFVCMLLTCAIGVLEVCDGEITWDIDTKAYTVLCNDMDDRTFENAESLDAVLISFRNNGWLVEIV